MADFERWEQEATKKLKDGMLSANSSFAAKAHSFSRPQVKTTSTKSSVSQTTALARSQGEKLRPRNSTSAPEKFQPSNAAGSRCSSSYRQMTGKRKRDDDIDDAESLLSNFFSPAAERTPVALKAKPSELAEHVSNNVVLLFHPRHNGPPRVRLLRSCDSVQKMFAQALAGDVFGGESGSGTKVLRLTFGGGQQKSRSLVEDDDQDYEDLVTALKGPDCWSMDDGALQGSLTVEVRAR